MTGEFGIEGENENGERNVNFCVEGEVCAQNMREHIHNT